jgi:hypothetical protein
MKKYILAFVVSLVLGFSANQAFSRTQGLLNGGGAGVPAELVYGDGINITVTPDGGSSTSLKDAIFGSAEYVVDKEDSYTLSLGDQNTYFRMGKATAQTVTIPPNSTDAFPVGSIVYAEQSGVGELSVVGGSGVTLLPSDPVIASGKNSVLVMKKVDTDTWNVGGATSISASAYSIYANSTASPAAPDFTTSPVISGQLTAADVNVTDSYKIRGNEAFYIPVSDSGYGSLAVGTGALLYLSSTTASYSNTAIGMESMEGDSGTLITGINNTAVGRSSLKSVTTGSSNTAVCLNAGFTITTGTNNTAVGVNALGSTGSKTGSNNTAFGYNSSTILTSGQQNVAVGGSTLSSNLSGSSNVVVGYASGLSITGGNNTCLGYRGCQTLSTGTNNVTLGFEVGKNTLSTGSNNILIGTSNSVDTPASDTSNYLNIGNILTGVMTGTPSSQYISVEGGVEPSNLTADPCGTYPEGAIFYNDTSDYMCFCNGTGNDVQVHSPTTACY